MDKEWKKIVSAIRRKVIKPIKESNKENIKKIKNNKKINHQETIGLLLQAYETLNNAENNLNSFRIVDACVLMRSAFEYIAMGIVIQFDEDTFNEFKKLGLEERDKTRIIKILDKLKKNMNEISNNFYSEISQTKKEELLQEMYNKLCNFTHSSIVVSTIVEIEDNNEKKILRLSLLQSLYFLESLLFFSLKYFMDDESHYIEWENVWLASLLTNAKVGLISKNNNINFSKYDDFLYYKENKEYMNKNKKTKEKTKKQYNEISNYIKDNTDDFAELLKKFLS